MDEITNNPEWYIGVPYSEKKVIIGDNFNSMTRDYISSGYFLRDINEHKEYLEDGFSDIYEFAEHTYGLKKSSVNHCMRINAAFSKNGNSPILDEKYKGFGRSQLQELLYVPEEKWEEISPQMTVREIREVRKPRLDVEPESEQMNESDCPEILPEEPVSILGYPKRVYPEGSLIATPGCGKQDCFSCHRDGCDIRQGYCYCVEAPMGNPFPCTTLNVVENLREEIGNRCQFVNSDLADIRNGDGQPVPCCKKCENPCGYECGRSVRKRVEVKMPQIEQEPDEELKQPEEAENAEIDTDQENRYPATLQEYAAQAGTEEGVPEPDESWNIGDLLQAKEKYLKRLARVLFKECPALRSRLTESSVRRDIEFLGSKYKKGIDIGDGVKAWPCAEIIEFGAGKNGEEELGVCSYERFFTQVKKAAGEWDDEKSESVEKKSQVQEPSGDNEAEDTRTEETTPLSDLEIAKEKLERENKMLTDMLACFTENDFRVRKQNIVVAALTAYITDLDNILNPLPEPEQPELPIMKNNDQRKEWLRNYKSWGLWYEDEHIGAKFYKFEFENGATLIAETYTEEKTEYHPERESCYLHLVGGPACKHDKYGQIKYRTHGQYSRFPNSETELVEFLKEVQKK